MPTIKRYPNRKLYDTEAKRYVTLDQITQMIRNGDDVQVVDYETGADLTTLTLTQIILEQEKKSADGFLPRSLLTSLIRTGGGTLEQLLRSVQFGLIRPGGDASTESETDDEGQDLESPDAELAEDNAEDKQASSALDASSDDWQEELLHMFKMPSQRDLRALREQLTILNKRLDEVLESKEIDLTGEVDADGDATSV